MASENAPGGEGPARPSIGAGAWVAPTATLVGRATLGVRSSLWHGVTVRADFERIEIGDDTNVQDGAVLHADPGFPLIVGDRVSIGHRAVLHGCTVGTGTLIGIGAVVLNGATIGAGSMIAAGAIILEGTDVPPGSLVAGVPGKIRRALTEDDRAGILLNADAYVRLAARAARGEFEPWRP